MKQRKNMTHVLIHSLTDSLKILPFLFGAYLLIEFLEHKTREGLTDKLRHIGPLGPLIGGLLGLVPQCGFSVTASNFYAGRLISVGTLVAVFLSTSDEALLMILADPSSLSYLWKLLLVKLLIAFVAGIGLDLLWKILGRQKNEAPFEELCEHCHCGHGSSIWRSALNHTIKIFLFILVINVVLHGAIEWVGEETLGRLFLVDSFWQPFLTALLGLIPNCAASVLITELFIGGTLSFGSAVAGLCTGAGLGLVVLFRTHHHLKENFVVMGYMYGVAVVAGVILNAIGI